MLKDALNGADRIYNLKIDKWKLIFFGGGKACNMNEKEARDILTV